MLVSSVSGASAYLELPSTYCGTSLRYRPADAVYQLSYTNFDVRASVLILPIAPLFKEGVSGMKVKDLLRMKIFWILLIMMVCQKAERHYFLYIASYRNPTNATIPPLRMSKGKIVPLPILAQL